MGEIVGKVVELLGAPIHWASVGLFTILRYDVVVLLLCLGGVLWCWHFIRRNKQAHFNEAMQALQAREDALSQVAGSGDPVEAQAHFGRDFDTIAEVMARPDRKELSLAWEQFRETFIDENEPVIRTTARSEAYFLHLADDTRVLAWGANIAVALGLTATFLGLIAALTGATDALGGATDGTQTADALRNLLQVTAAKFWMSVTGIICSIWLRRTDRKWHEHLQLKLENLCQLLDRGTQFTPGPKLAAEQLREMKRQTEAFQVLGTDLATAIDNALTNPASPVVSVLGSINASIEQFGKGGFNQISQDLGKALGEHAGREMQELGATLGVMATKFDQLSTGLSDVPATLENTFREMRAQFETEQSETRRRQTEASEQLFGQLGGLAERLEGVTGQFSEDLAERLKETINTAADTSGEALGKAFAEFGTRMSESTDDLVQRLALLASNAEPLSEAMIKAATATTQQAERLEIAGRSTEEAGSKLAAAATELNTVLGPIASAAKSASDAAAAISTALAAHERATEELTGQLIATASSAEDAWSSYQGRFDGVDEALGKTLDNLISATAQHATAVNQQVGVLDHELAKAVSSLKDTLDPLEELAGEISSLLEKLNN